jgi:hypothetical protein
MSILRCISYVAGLYACVSAYSPEENVRRMHALPHLDSDLNTVDNEFDITATSPNKEYMTSLVIFPVIIGVIALIVILGYIIGMVFRCCCNCCKFGPSDDPTESDLITKRNLTIACISFIILVVAFNFTILSGNAHLTEGVKTGELLSLLAARTPHACDE